MRITGEQIEVLESLACHRLSSRDEHQKLIHSFENSRNPNLVKSLRDNAWEEDLDGSTAYYLIKNKEGVPLFFFSLKCGALYRHFDEEQITERKKFYAIAKRLLDNPQNKKEEELAAILREQYRVGKDISDKDIKRFLSEKTRKKQNLLEFLSGDKSKDPNKHIIRVSTTHSGIELVHFCANEKAKNLWKSYNLPQSVGKVVYWYYIVPILQRVRDAVGCKYLFLFAADNTEDGSLINYYNLDLKLNRPDDIGTSKPIYDWNCVFMCNEITALLKHRDAFLQSFNAPKQTDAV